MDNEGVIVVKDGKSTKLKGLAVNGKSVSRAYALKGANETFILIFDNRESDTMSRNKIVAGNWKMNPSSKDEAVELANTLKRAIGSVASECKCVIFPPTCFIDAVATALADCDVEVGAQNVHYEKTGAYTGQVSVSQVKSCGATWVMVGHSETREYIADDNSLFNKQIQASLQNGLKVIYCVGEDVSEYESNISGDVVRVQLAGGLLGITPEQMANVVVAYEPIWAIGTGKTCSNMQANVMHEVIRKWIKEKYGTEVAEKAMICYGGSVNASNTQNLVAEAEIDGVMAGGASLKLDFATIVDRAFGRQ